MFINVIIADDHPIFRQGLKSVIESDQRFKILGEAANGREAVSMVEALCPDIVILDIDMPEIDGIEAAKRISKSTSGTKICFLTLHNDLQLLNATKLLNVDGYLLKDDAGEEIIDCLVKIKEGRSYVSPHILRTFSKQHDTESNGRHDTQDLSSLTPAERRIIKRISETKTNREIADELFISIRTVENHRFNICTKLDLRGNHSLLKFAMANKKILDAFD